MVVIIKIKMATYHKEMVFLSYVKKFYEEDLIERIVENFYTFLKYSNLYLLFFFFFFYKMNQKLDSLLRYFSIFLSFNSCTANVWLQTSSSYFIAILSCICVKIPGKRKWNCFLQEIWDLEFEKERKWNQRGFSKWSSGISSLFDRLPKAVLVCSLLSVFLSVWQYYYCH